MFLRGCKWTQLRKCVERVKSSIFFRTVASSWPRRQSENSTQTPILGKKQLNVSFSVVIPWICNLLLSRMVKKEIFNFLVYSSWGQNKWRRHLVAIWVKSQWLKKNDAMARGRNISGKMVSKWASFTYFFSCSTMWIVALIEFTTESANESQLLIAEFEARVPAQRAVAKDPQFRRLSRYFHLQLWFVAPIKCNLQYTRANKCCRCFVQKNDERIRRRKQ